MRKCPLAVWWKSRGQKQGESPWWHLSHNLEQSCRLFSGISSSHSFLSAAASALRQGDQCSRVLAVPVPWMLVAVPATPRRACKRNSTVDLYQDFETTILPSVGGCSFTSLSYHRWHFPDEALWFHPPFIPFCFFCSLLGLLQTTHILPRPHGYPCLGPITQMKGIFGGSSPHAVALHQPGGIAVCKP